MFISSNAKYSYASTVLTSENKRDNTVLILKKILQ